jgi:hypothetical protein
VGNAFRGVQVPLPASDTPTDPTVFTLKNNIVASNDECGVFIENPGLQAIDYNDVVGQRYQYCGFPDMRAHNISPNPRFMAPAGEDFHLAAGSTAINHGYNNLAPTIDYDDIQRRQYYNVDMGALEFIYLRTFLPAILKVPPQYANP